jgi:hypothetical protein
MNLRNFIVLLGFMVCATALFAQHTERFDRIIMKDGGEYQGTITEFDLFGTTSMRLDDGRLIRVDMTDVERIVRREEEVLNRSHNIDKFTAERIFMPEKFYPHERQPMAYFFQLQLTLEYGQFGFHFVNGYRISSWHQLGLGFGFDNTRSSVTFIPSHHNARQDQIAGIYLPLFLQYGGDIPTGNNFLFYNVELGYAFNLLHYEENKSSPLGLGGLHAATVVGIKFRTKRKYTFDLGFRMGFRPNEIMFREYTFDRDNGLLQLHDTQKTVTSLFLGVSIIHSFGR